MKQLLIFIALLYSNSLWAQLSESNLLLILKAYNQSQQFDKANQLLYKIQESPEPELLLQKGLTLYYSGDYKGAANCFFTVTQKEPDMCNFELARCYALMNKPELACSYLEKHLNQKEKKMQYEIKSDTAFQHIEKSPEWLQLWKNEWYTKYDLMFEDAEYEFRKKNYEEALKIVNDLISIRKTKYEAYALKAEIYEALGEYQNGLITLAYALNKRSKNAEFYYLQSRLEMAISKNRKALKSIEQALKLDSSQVEYFYLKTQALANLNKTKACYENLDFLIQLYPVPKVFALASDIYKENNQLQKAIKEMNHCIEMDKYNPDYYIKRGDLYQSTGLFEFAEKDYSMSLDFYPEKGELFFKRGLARLNQQKFQEACSDFNKAYQYQYMPANDYIGRYCRDNLK